MLSCFTAVLVLPTTWVSHLSPECVSKYYTPRLNELVRHSRYWCQCQGHSKVILLSYCGGCGSHINA